MSSSPGRARPHPTEMARTASSAVNVSPKQSGAINTRMLGTVTWQA